MYQIPLRGLRHAVSLSYVSISNRLELYAGWLILPSSRLWQPPRERNQGRRVESMEEEKLEGKWLILVHFVFQEQWVSNPGFIRLIDNFWRAGISRNSKPFKTTWLARWMNLKECFGLLSGNQVVIGAGILWKDISRCSCKPISFWSMPSPLFGCQ